MRVIPGAVAFALVTILPAAAAAGATPTAVCAGTKLKASGKFAAVVLSCEARATLLGAGLDGACVERASAKFAVTLAKADARGGCAPTGDLQAIVRSATSALHGALRPVDTANRCASSKLEGAGRRAKAKLACHAKATARGLTVDLTCLVRAETRFAADFAKAETRPPCLTTGDVAGIENAVDDLVDDLVAAIPAVPPSTTTTISTSTTTTSTSPACAGCGPGEVCRTLCAPESPVVCEIPFAGACNMTGTWLPFVSSIAYSIVERANGMLDVVAFDGTGTDFWTTTGTRSGVSVSIGTSGDPFYFSGILTSCDAMQAPDGCPVFERSSTATCGDGILQSDPFGEQCDDGNHVAGDCCSPICGVEPGCP
jgi:cysteine-rich repeat protein